MIQDGLRREIERALGLHVGSTVILQNASALGGGCINNAQAIETSAGPFFLKWNARPLPEMFLREAEGLRALNAVGAIRVPIPIAASNGSEEFPPYLLTTYIRPAARARDFSENFGRRFALLHKQGRGTRFGFEHDNYIGSTPQPNGWMEDWVSFYRERRLGFQLRLARQNGHVGEIQHLGDKLLEKLDRIIAEPNEPPTLLHGDLWSGNFMIGEDGYAVIIDPATYYGRREADLAMTQLFGGFDQRFQKAYEEEYPLPPGSRERLDVYKLYHLLNHLNIFGGDYLSGCLEILRRYA